MSVFESIKNAIFHHGASTASAKSASTPSPAPASPPRTAQPSSTVSDASPQPANRRSPEPSVQQQPVDVEATLNGLAAKNPQKLNWQQSIVDLMKLLGLDPSLHNRTMLAKELGYNGDASDSAAMNVWLHKQVMNKLAENGGRVPQSLRS